MKLNTSNPLGVLCLFFSIITLFSCSKDSDLMADYVALDREILIGKYVKSDSYLISIISNTEEDNYEIAINSGSEATIVNDTYQISSSASIVLDVLANDTFKNIENVSIIETSQPNSGSVVINSDNTLTYTPETTESIVDTFIYTAQVVNEDQSVTTEDGTVIVEVTNSANKNGTIELNTLKAFPSAFGAGQNLTGGRDGSYYAVTNLNNSGAGSFREALNQGSNTIIIIQVEGLVNLTSPISGSSPDNITIWGQMAPGKGLTLSNERITFEGSNNWIVRHMTFQNRNPACSDPKAGGADCRSAVAWRSMTQVGGLGHYIDHVSARWGMDQTVDIGHGQPSNESTMAYCFLGQGTASHNTGGFVGGFGKATYARNALVSLSHRFAIHSGGSIESYNNYIVNYGSRLANARASTQIDYFHNYVERGNANGPSQNAVNKLEGSGVSGMRTYTANNYVEHIDESPNGLQTNLWQNRNNSEGPNFTGIDSYHYVSGRLNDFGAPPDGVWDATNGTEVKIKALANAGHNRGINTNGTPGFFRDDVDEDFATRATNGTTRSTRLTDAQFFNSSFAGTAMYADTDGDYMPDWFENQHPHLNPNEDDKNEKHVDWNFGEYNVLNNAGYTNLEMCAEFYAGGFETMID